jgi:hypothetical protein
MSAAFNTLDPRFQPAARALFDWAARVGLNPRVTSARRSRSQQARLYRRYLQGLSPLPAAPPGRSLHEIGWAFDMVTDDMPRTGRTWRSWGGTWYDHDPPHFEPRR